MSHSPLLFTRKKRVSVTRVFLVALGLFLLVMFGITGCSTPRAETAPATRPTEYVSAVIVNNDTADEIEVWLNRGGTRVARLGWVSMKSSRTFGITAAQNVTGTEISFTARTSSGWRTYASDRVVAWTGSIWTWTIMRNDSWISRS